MQVECVHKYSAPACLTASDDKFSRLRLIANYRDGQSNANDHPHMVSGSFLLIPPERARQFICVRRIIAVDVKVAEVNQAIPLGFTIYMQINVINQPEIPDTKRS